MEVGEVLWQLPPPKSVTSQLEELLTELRKEADLQKRIKSTPRVTLFLSSGDRISGVPVDLSVRDSLSSSNLPLLVQRFSSSRIVVVVGRSRDYTKLNLTFTLCPR